MNNKRLGNAFEREFCQILHSQGYWVHKLQDNKNGQPFDVIAAKDGKTYVFDCKVCENNKFPLSRIEENQANAMTMWENRGNSIALFALKVNDQIRIIPYKVLRALQLNGMSVLNLSIILSQSVVLSKWIGGESFADNNQQ